MLEALLGDITRESVDAIVNAANPRLLGGGGVDGAIHRAAGPGLLAECRAIPEVAPGVRCPTGEARLTGGHALRARHVIHTAGPVWGEHGPAQADALLASCYRSALALATTHGLTSLAFPCISTGVYGFPAERAARVAVEAVRRAGRIELVRFVCFLERDYALYRDLLGVEGPT